MLSGLSWCLCAAQESHLLLYYSTAADTASLMVTVDRAKLSAALELEQHGSAQAVRPGVPVANIMQWLQTLCDLREFCESCIIIKLYYGR